MALDDTMRLRARFALGVLPAFWFASLAANAGAAPTNKADERPGPITDHFSLRASFFAPSVTTAARFDSDAGRLGTPLSAESDLGLDDKVDQGRVELIFRLRPRHRLRFDYFKLDRDGDRILTKPINFGNSTYNVSERVISSIGWRMIGLTYTWSVVQTKNVEIGAGLGLHIVEAQAHGDVRARNLREDGSGVGAIPTAALDGTWQFARRWSANAHAQRFSVTVSDVHGSYYDYHFDSQYRWRPNMAFGVGWTWLKTDVNIANSKSLPGAFALSTRGPEVFFRASF